MKNFKRIMVGFLLTALMIVTLSGCGKRGECEDCGQNEKLNKYVEEDGDVHWYCDDCYRMEKLFGF